MSACQLPFRHHSNDRHWPCCTRTVQRRATGKPRRGTGRSKAENRRGCTGCGTTKTTCRRFPFHIPRCSIVVKPFAHKSANQLEREIKRDGSKEYHDPLPCTVRQIRIAQADQYQADDKRKPEINQQKFERGTHQQIVQLPCPHSINFQSTGQQLRAEPICVTAFRFPPQFDSGHNKKGRCHGVPPPVGRSPFMPWRLCPAFPRSCIPDRRSAWLRNCRARPPGLCKGRQVHHR